METSRTKFELLLVSFLFVFFFFLCIIVDMSSETWGMMPKSQIDPQLIEERIAEMIAEHESDPDAHLGDGESLQAHRQNEVIDHPQSSVLADKMTSTEQIIRTNFESLDGWSQTGNVGLESISSAYLSIESGDVVDSRLVALPLFPYPFLTKTKDFVFQNSSQFFIDDSDFFFVLGLFTSTWPNPVGFGFVYNSGELKGVVRTSTASGETSALSVDLSEPHIYRAFLSVLDSAVHFYIDGELVGSVSLPSGSFPDEVPVRLRLATVGDGIVTWRTGELILSRQF